MKQVDMSFGFSPSDVVLLVQLAWRTVQNSRKACGEHAELTCEIKALHINLQRLERESVKVESPLNRPSDTCREDLAPIVNGCGKALDVLDRILEKYNALSDGQRRKGKLWKAVRFGNGELANVKDLRSKLVYYTANLSLFLNMVSMGSMGIVEKQMYEAGGDLKEIRRAMNNITAHLMSGANKDGSVLTDYADDDKAVWRAFRRELVKDGFSSDVIREHKNTIQAYVKELGTRGILDDEDLKDSGNVSQKIEDREATRVTPRSRDEAMGSFESKSGAASDAVSSSSAIFAKIDRSYDLEKAFARIDELYEENKEFARINRLFEEEKETRERMEQEEKVARINKTFEEEKKTREKMEQEEKKFAEVEKLFYEEKEARERREQEEKKFARTEKLFEEEKETRERMEQFHKSQHIKSANLTMSNVLDTLPSITQAHAEINSVAESDSREVEKVDDRTNKHPSSAPIPLGQAVPEIAEEDTWFLGQGDSRPNFRYYEWHYDSWSFFHTHSAIYAESFERLSNPHRARGKTLEFQAEAKGFLKVAELRTELRIHPSLGCRRSLLKLSSLFHDPKQGILFGVLLVIDKGHPNNIMNGLMQWCLRSVDACPEKWRITEWPLPREETEREGHEDGDKGKRSTSTTFSTEGGQAHAPPAASASAEDTQDPPSTTEESETDDDESDDIGHISWIKNGWQGLANRARRRQKLEDESDDIGHYSWIKEEKSDKGGKE